MKFSSNKVLTLPVIADINSVAINDPAVDIDFDMAADCDGGAFSDVNIGVLIVATMDFFTYDEYLVGVKDQEIDPTEEKVIGAVISCPNYWAMLNMNVAQFVAALGFCCSTIHITSAPYALKTTASPLTPGQIYPCGTQAGFKWLAVFGNEDPPTNYTRFFEIELQNADASIILVDVLSTGPLVATIQTILNWPANFIGLTIDGITIVGNDEVAGVNELNVGEFDFGKITIRVRLVDGPTELIAETEFSLPDTTCGGGGSGSSGESGSSSSEPESGSGEFNDSFGDEFFI